MTRGFHIALMGLLGLLAAGQVSISLRQAVQLPSPPPLYTPVSAPDESTTAGADVPPGPTVSAPAVATPLPSPTVATPDPANILRIVVSADRITPARMQAEAGTHLQLMVTDKDQEPRALEVIGPDGRVAVKTPLIKPGSEETVSFDLPRGRHRVRVAGTDLEAELLAP